MRDTLKLRIPRGVLVGSWPSRPRLSRAPTNPRKRTAEYAITPKLSSPDAIISANEGQVRFAADTTAEPQNRGKSGQFRAKTPFRVVGLLTRLLPVEGQQALFPTTMAQDESKSTTEGKGFLC